MSKGKKRTEAVKCSECEYCREFRPVGNTRSEFWCDHPNKEYIKEYYKKHRINRSEGFLEYGKPYEHQVPLKTSPRWCPKKEAQI